MKKLIEAIRKRIRSVIEETQQNREEAEKARGKAQERGRAAKANKDAAVIAGDMQAYHKAMSEEGFAQAEESFYAQKLNGLNSARLVTDAENRDVVSKIRAAQQKLHDEALEKVMALTEQIEETGKTYFANQDELNELLKAWHRDVYRQDDPMKNRLASSVDLKFKDDELRLYITGCVTAYNYRKHKGLDGYHGSGSIWT